MRPILSVLLTLSLVFTQVTPFAFAGEPVSPDPNRQVPIDEPGDFVSGEAHQAAQAQQEADLARQDLLLTQINEIRNHYGQPYGQPSGLDALNALRNAIAVPPRAREDHGEAHDTSFITSPSYTDEIGIGDDFQATFQIGNSANDTKPVEIVIVMTPVGSTNPDDSKEFSFGVNIPAGGRTVVRTITNEQLTQAEIGPGAYTVAFILIDAEGRAGESFGNPFVIGSIEPTFTQLPTYTTQIDLGEPFQATFQLGNTGDAPAPVTVLVVMTRAGTDQTVEFSRTTTVPAGGKSFDLVLSPQELADAGITEGLYTVGFIVFDSLQLDQVARAVREGDYTADGRVDLSDLNFVRNNFGSQVNVPGRGDETIDLDDLNAVRNHFGADLASVRVGQFSGNPLEVGDVGEPTFTEVPTYTDAIAAGADFEATFTIGNTGGTSVPVTLLTVITPVGTNQSKEFYQAAQIPAGGESVIQRITAAQRAAMGLGEGQFTVAFIVFDANDNRIGQFFGNPLTIGNVAQPTFTQAPTYTDVVPVNEAFRAAFTFGNPGSTDLRVTMLAVITRAGTNESIEFYRPGTVPVGGGSLEFVLTYAELEAAGIGAGYYTVTFVAYDGLDRRIGGPTHGFFGNPLQVGEIAPLSFDMRPTFTETVASGGEFRATFTIGNPNSSSQNATLLAVFRKIGDDPADPASFKEFYQPVTVPTGGGSFQFTLNTGTAGLGDGQYVVSFRVLDPLEVPVGPQDDPAERGFFGNIVTLGNPPAAGGAAPRVEALDADEALPGDYDDDGDVDLADLNIVRNEFGGESEENGYNLDDLNAVRNQFGIIEVGGVDFLTENQISAGNRAGLIPSYPDIQPNDPLYAFIGQRGYTYDQAVAAVGLVAAGRLQEAREILLALQALENGTGRIGFSYALGNQGGDDTRLLAGTLAWVGLAFTSYLKAAGLEGNNEFLATAERIARELYPLIHPDLGLVRLGYRADGTIRSGISTEHNVDAYFFFKDLYDLIGPAEIFGPNIGYGTVAEKIAEGMIQHLWAGNRFRRGYNDDILVLDAQSWGGIFLLSRGENQKAALVRDTIERAFKRQVTVDGQTVVGYAPYLGDRFIWVEGTAGVALFDRRLGNLESAELLESSMEQFCTDTGGLQYASSRNQTTLPDDDTVFTELSSVASTGWYIIQKRNSDRFWEISVPPIVAQQHGGAHDVELTFTELPTYPASIGKGEDFRAIFQVGNSGSELAPITVLVVFTAVGSTQSKEFYRTATISPGGGSVEVVLTADELASQGVIDGFAYTVGFAVFDSHLMEQIMNAIEQGDYDDNGMVNDSDLEWVRAHFGQVVGEDQINLTDLNNVRNALGAELSDARIGQFLDNPLTIGTIDLSFPVIPFYTAQVNTGKNFRAVFDIFNNAVSPANVTVTAVITRGGDPDFSKEFSAAGTILQGGDQIILTVGYDELQAQGILPGVYIVSFVAFDSLGNRIGGLDFGYLGNPLTIG